MNPASTNVFPLENTRATKRLAQRIAPHLKAGDLVVAATIFDGKVVDKK